MALMSAPLILSGLATSVINWVKDIFLGMLHLTIGPTSAFSKNKLPVASTTCLPQWPPHLIYYFFKSGKEVKVCAWRLCKARKLSFLKSLQDVFTQNLKYLLHPPFKTLNINIQLNPAISKSQGKWKKVRNSGVLK